MDDEIIDVGKLLNDLKDFYVWKQFANDKEFVSKWVRDREGLLESITRPTMSK